MFQGPSVREVQAAVGNLREVSLCVVEVVQAWRREKQKELSQRKRGDDITKSQSALVSWGASGDHKASPRNRSPAGPEHSNALNDGEIKAQGGSLEVRFPVVPTARSVHTGDEELPIYWWFCPETTSSQIGAGSTQTSRRASLGPESSVPEQIGHDPNEESAAPAATTPKVHRHSDGAKGNSTPAPVGSANADRSSTGHTGSASPRPSPARAGSGVNYLARMATDTDFVGAPGSVLVDFFPPDTKLYRNPFVLGHNLDDTLAIVPGGGGAASPRRDRGDQDGARSGGSSPATVKKGRLDTRRVRLASAAIVAEDARERSGKRRRGGEYEDQGASGGTSGEGASRKAAELEDREENSLSVLHDREHFDRLDSGDSKNADGDRGNSSNSSKKRKGKGGIRFQDQQSEG